MGAAEPPVATPEDNLHAAGSVSSRRAPYPWDVLLNGQGLRLREGVMGKRILPLENYSAPVQEYGTDDLYLERSYVFRRAYAGMGDSSQQSNGNPPRSFYASNAWHHGAYRGQGPRWHPIVPVGGAAGEHAGFVEAVGPTAGALALFALAGRYVRRVTGLNDPDQALSLDLGAGVVVETATRWTAAGVTGGDGLYLTDSNAHLWRHQVGTWTDLSATTSAPDCRFICTTGVELWRALGNVVSKCEGDPGVGASWTADIPVGDEEVPISGLGQLWGQLFVFKQDGTVWTLQGGADVGRARNVAPGLAVTPHPANGRRPASWDNALYFSAGAGFWRLTSSGAGVTVDRVGPERLVDNTSPVRGPVTAFCGYDAFGAYGAVHNTSEGAAFLLGYGNWVPTEEASPDAGSFRFTPAWNGSLLDLAGERITALAVTQLSAVVGAPDPANPWTATDRGNPLLFVGLADGTYGYVALPRDGANPFSPAAHLGPDDFTDRLSFTRWPRHTLMAPGDIKAFLSFAATGPVLDEARAVRPEFRIDPVGEADPWSTVAVPLTENGRRVLFPDDSWGRVIDVREVYATLAPAPVSLGEGALAAPPGTVEGRATDLDRLPGPVVATLTLREQVRPAFRLEYAGTVMAHWKVARRDGGSSRLTPPQTRNLVVAAAQDPGHTFLTMPDETVGRFALIQFQETVPPDGAFRRRGLAWDLALTAVQYRTQSVFGIFDRLNATTFGSLDDRTFHDLATW